MVLVWVLIIIIVDYYDYYDYYDQDGSGLGPVSGFMPPMRPLPAGGRTRGLILVKENQDDVTNASKSITVAMTASRVLAMGMSGVTSCRSTNCHELV